MKPFDDLTAEALPASIGALLDDAAQAAPDAVAWHFTENAESVSYGELQRAVNRLANGLAAAGVAAGAHVAVLLPNVSAMPMTWLALARLGAVMIPVNTRFTGRELLYVLEDCNASLLVIHEDLLPILDALPSPVPHLESRTYVVGSRHGRHRAWKRLASGDDRVPPGHPELDTPVSIQYTSGSTGSPKGCVLTHRYWLVCAKAYGQVDGLRYRRILADNPFFYMTPQWLLLMAFFHRATLYIAPRLSAKNWLSTVREHGIEYCLFRDAYHREPPTPRDRDHMLLRASLYMHRKEDELAFEQRFGPAVRTAFGMTEIGAGLVTPLGASHMTGTGTCGLPAPFRECRIGDGEGNTVADGESGELLIRGPGLLLGYHGQPEATAAAFHGDWFRTGDLARRDEHGYFYIIGRLKDMIKRAGENIAPNEVEAVLEMIPGVAEAAVVGVPDERRGEEVKAVLVLAGGRSAADLPKEAVLEHCRRNLAVFKLPRYIEYRSAPLPRTASGKVSKALLKAEVRE